MANEADRTAPCRMLRVWSSADFKAQEPPTTHIRGEVLKALQVYANDWVLHIISIYMSDDLVLHTIFSSTR
jgi:hypothetical protein